MNLNSSSIILFMFDIMLMIKEKTEIALSKLKATPVLTIKNILIKALYLSGHSE